MGEGGLDGVVRVGDIVNDLEVLMLIKQAPQTNADDLMVIDNQYSQMHRASKYSPNPPPATMERPQPDLYARPSAPPVQAHPVPATPAGKRGSGRRWL